MPTSTSRTAKRAAPNLHVPKVAELVAAHLRAQIVDGELGEGDELPRESVLLHEFGVSRPSLREALRVLETEGLVQIRRGNVGGAVVRRPTVTSAAYHLSLTLRANAVTHRDLGTARLAIEPLCAALAADLPHRQAIADQLSDLVDESERCTTIEAFTASAHVFHHRLTELCGNTTMMVVAGTLESVWSAQETLALDIDLDHDPEGHVERGRSIAAHRRIVAAIAAGDGEQASQEMRVHLAQAQDVLVDERGATAIELTTTPVSRPRPAVKA